MEEPRNPVSIRYYLAASTDKRSREDIYAACLKNYTELNEHGDWGKVYPIFYSGLEILTIITRLQYKQKKNP